MIDINLIINDVEEIKKKLGSRGYNLDDSLIVKLFQERKKLILKKESHAAEKNILVNDFKKSKTNTDKDNIKIQSQRLDDLINENKKLLNKVENDLTKLMQGIPNIPSSTTPIGNEDCNEIIKTWGKPNNNQSDHSQILSTNYLDFESAVSMSKPRFAVLKGDISKLHRALVNYMMDIHTDKNGYTEYNVPYIVNSSSLIGTGQLPKFEEDLFKIADSDLYLIPTAEVPLTNIYRNKIIDESDLPVKIVSHTPCFRSEAGSYGKDTKGIIRLHQFEKVELVQIVNPANELKSLESILTCAEEILESLEIPYRRVVLASNDLGFSSSLTYDIEAWYPGQSKYREISSCSSFTDFQSRRLNIKYKNKATKKKSLAYTLNGSGLAIGRTLAALVENHLRTDTLSIPKVLQKYTGFDIIRL